MTQWIPSSWVLTLEKYPRKNNRCLSVRPSVCLSVSPRHKWLKECSDRKIEWEQSCSKFSEDDSYSSDFFSCGARSRAKRVFAFSRLWGSTRRRSPIEKVKGIELVCYPKKHTTTTSLVRLPLTREERFFVFSTIRKYQKEALNRKSSEKQTCFSSQENQHTIMTSLRQSWPMREARFYVFASMRKYQKLGGLRTRKILRELQGARGDLTSKEGAW